MCVCVCVCLAHVCVCVGDVRNVNACIYSISSFGERAFSNTINAQVFLHVHFILHYKTIYMYVWANKKKKFAILFYMRENEAINFCYCKHQDHCGRQSAVTTVTAFLTTKDNACQGFTGTRHKYRPILLANTHIIIIIIIDRWLERIWGQSSLPGSLNDRIKKTQQ